MWYGCTIWKKADAQKSGFIRTVVATQMKTTCKTSSRKWRRKFVSVIALPYHATSLLSPSRCTVKTSQCPFGSIAYFLVRASRLTARAAGFQRLSRRKRWRPDINCKIRRINKWISMFSHSRRSETIQKCFNANNVKFSLSLSHSASCRLFYKSLSINTIMILLISIFPSVIQ